MDSRLMWIWLAQVLPAGSSAVNKLLDTFTDAAGVYAATEEDLQKAGFSAAVRRPLAEKSLDTARRILDKVLEEGDWVLTPEDALYPRGLRHINGCPAVLYVRGVFPDPDISPVLAVVGTRSASPEGWREAYALARGLAAGGLTVVSGGAVGIDAAAHTGALDAGGTTLAVLGCPTDVSYPAENEPLRRRIVENGGGLISEFPPTLPYKCDYHIRNRLLVGLSLGVCLAETPRRSGARITARLAREEGREVFALPGALAGHHYDGGHSEIQRGATLVMRAADILEEYAPQYPGLLDAEAGEEAQKAAERESVKPPEKTPRRPVKTLRPRKNREDAPETPAAPETAPAAGSAVSITCPPEVSPEGKTVFDALTASPQPVDVLAEKTGLPIPTLLSALTELEMFGCAVNSAGQQYARA